VRLLHDGSMERDMLDEHVRRALNMAIPTTSSSCATSSLIN
jgi:hypothetical protein